MVIFSKHRWLPFVLPLAVFLLVGSLEPTPANPGGQTIGLSISYAAYPWIYTLKIALTLAALLLVRSTFAEFPRHVTPLAIIVGIVGAAVWIGLSQAFGHSTRSQFNPFAELAGNMALTWGFFALRLVGLVIIVPLAEELFLRGFMMRFFVAAEWWKVPFGQLNALAIAVGTILPMFSHPGELVAAAVWFSMVTWLMVKTKNFWNCVVAHALTNLLLGIYVVVSGNWHLM